MTNQPPTTQQIIIEFLAKTTDALDKLKELAKKSEEAKQKIIEMGKASGASIKEIETALRLTTAEEGARNVDNLREALRRMREQAKDESKWSKEQNAQLKASIKDVEQTLKEEGRAGKEAGIAITQGARQANEETKKLQGTAAGVGGIFQGILKGGLALFGITSLISVLQKVIGFLGSAAQQGKEFAQSLFSLEVGVRALQRAGVEITFLEMLKQIEELKKKFGVFSRVDLVQGSAAFVNLNRDMGFTKDQLFELQNAIATLAIVNGRSMDEVQKTVALAISSGYTEGLQRLGVSINRVTIAEEAARLGWKGGYTALNEQQRALATYNLVIRKTAIYEEDLARYQKTLPGQIDTATKAIQDQTVAIGNNLLRVKLWITQAELGFFRLINAFTATKAAFSDFVDAFIKRQEEMKGAALDQGEINRAMEAAGEVWRAGVFRGGLTPQQMFERYKFPSERWNPILGDVDALQSETEQALARISAAVEKNLTDIFDLQDQFKEQSTELWEEYKKDLDEIWQEHWEKEKEIFDDFAEDFLAAQQEHADRVIDLQEERAEKEAEIETRYYDDLAKARADYERGINNTWTQYNNSLVKAQETYRNREIDAEARFQEKMLQLREGFIFDLEDAIQKRDARQVLNLTRRYALDRKQTEREYKLEKDRMARDFQQQMTDLARQRDERLAQLWEELQTRNAAITQEYKDELAKEEERNREAEEKERKSWDKRRTDLAAEYKKRSREADQDHDDNIKKRDQRYADDLTALENHFKDRYEQIGKALAAEVTLTDAEMGNLLKVLTDTLGPGGEAQLIFDSYIEAANAAATAVATILAYNNALSLAPSWIGGTLGNYNIPFPPPIRPKTGGRAKGGAEIATSATTATYGEAGPELALFLPLSRSLQGLGSTLSSINFAGGSQGRAGKAAIEIRLGPGLEGRITDKTMDMVADVILRRLR